MVPIKIVFVYFQRVTHTEFLQTSGRFSNDNPVRTSIFRSVILFKKDIKSFIGLQKSRICRLAMGKLMVMLFLLSLFIWSLVLISHRRKWLSLKPWQNDGNIPEQL